MKILVLANFGMGLYKFRKELLENLNQKECEVFVSMPKDEYVAEIEKFGCKYIETKLSRRGTNLFEDLSLLRSYLKMIKEINPDVVLSYTIKPNIYGGIACRVRKKPFIPNITGLGTAIEEPGMMQKILLLLYRIALKRAKCIFFQNKSNHLFFKDKKIIHGHSEIIPGSGVNISEFSFQEYPKENESIKFLFIGRVMKAKGIEELISSMKKVKEIKPEVEFHIVGFCEEEYSERLFKMNEERIISYHGKQLDVRSFIKQSHAIILPSYHEGTSNVLLESAAMGRPLLASDIPGCRETFDDHVSGMAFEVKNSSSLTSTILEFIDLPYDEKKKMGINGRKKIEKEYNRGIVVNKYIDEIWR